ncbi:phosphoinositide-interacting protein-like [Python bivittatus]|uniref:Phosphoinositide-interacting protein-like n=1 Tax=Python bivittatus TaxID=176946 RepID=A0A9F3QVM3_PYTBI|nr:phosphoinositide-interacting protein-like [Python bivittatus]
MSAVEQLSIKDEPPSSTGASNVYLGMRNETVNIQEQGKWVHYNKPVTLAVTGVLVFLTGISLSALYFSHSIDLPSAFGPICLSIGLMFFVTGVVWLSIVKRAIRYEEFLTKSVTDFGA